MNFFGIPLRWRVVTEIHRQPVLSLSVSSNWLLSASFFGSVNPSFFMAILRACFHLKLQNPRYVIHLFTVHEQALFPVAFRDFWEIQCRWWATNLAPQKKPAVKWLPTRFEPNACLHCCSPAFTVDLIDFVHCWCEQHNQIDVLQVTEFVVWFDDHIVAVKIISNLRHDTIGPAWTRTIWTEPRQR